MVEFPRKADGRRVVSVAFKQETVAQITIRVTGFVIQADAFLQDSLPVPGAPARTPVYNRQDFALAVINACDPGEPSSCP